MGAGAKRKVFQPRRSQQRQHSDGLGLDITYIEAISFTPKHFLTSEMIILSLPPSPVSPESGTAGGAAVASSSATTAAGSTRELPALSAIEAMFSNSKVELGSGEKGNGGEAEGRGMGKECEQVEVVAGPAKVGRRLERFEEYIL